MADPRHNLPMRPLRTGPPHPAHRGVDRPGQLATPTHTARSARQRQTPRRPPPHPHLTPVRTHPCTKQPPAAIFSDLEGYKDRHKMVCNSISQKFQDPARGWLTLSRDANPVSRYRGSAVWCRLLGLCGPLGGRAVCRGSGGLAGLLVGAGQGGRGRWGSACPWVAPVRRPIFSTGRPHRGCEGRPPSVFVRTRPAAAPGSGGLVELELVDVDPLAV
jgi:hypothetical protein